jgi:glycosyltransferase involved in cell wall biosynthesis
MIRSFVGKFVQVTIKNNNFVIRPLKKFYQNYKESFPRLTYNAWAEQNEEKCFVTDETTPLPLISIVVPVYNPEESDFLGMVYSVANQHYGNWELIIANASSDASRQRISDSKHIDTRISVIELKKNNGISGNTNAALGHCRGEYIAFLDHDDLLHPCALHCAAYAITNQSAEVIYTDEDKIKGDSSLYFEPFRKPSWSPDLLRNVNYINHFTVMKAEFVRSVGGLQPERDGTQDYDLLLRVIDLCKPKIIHVPRVLYHWRAARSSTAANFSIKEYVLRAGVKTLQEHYDRNNITGTVKAIKNRPGFYTADYELSNGLSVVVGKVESASHRICVAWLVELMEEMPDAEIIAGQWLQAYADQFPAIKIKSVSSDAPHYWRQAAELVGKGAILCFTTAASPRSAKHLLQLCGFAEHNSAIVAPVLVSESNFIIDAGLVEADYGRQYLFRECKLGDSTYYGSTEWVRNVAGLTGNVLAIKKEYFRQLTDLSEGYELSNKVLNRDYWEKQGIRLVSYAHAPFVFKGSLANYPLINQHYFNPGLTQASAPSIGVKVAAWGNLGDSSERERT